MKILITGSRGFVGGSMGRFAVAAGHDVLGIARSSQPEADWSGQYVQADVMQAPLAEILSEFAPDVVLHGAGSASVGASFHTPLEDFRAAVMTWANTLESIRQSGIRPVILFPSSAAVYGSPVVLPVAEEAAVAPVSPYGFHKAACELVAQEYAECFGLNIVVCRLFSLFGVRQRRLLVWELFEQLRGPEGTVWLQGTGRESRDYLPVDDVAAVMLQVAAHPDYTEPTGTLRVLNLGSGIETSVLALAEEMRAQMGADKAVACRGQAQSGNPVRWVADTSRLRALLPEWQPSPLPSSLGACLRSWQERSK